MKIDLYIQMKNKVCFEDKKTIYLEDVADIVSNDINIDKYKKKAIKNIHPDKENTLFLVTIFDIIQKLSEEKKEIHIQNLGATETLIEVKKKKKEIKLLEYLKVFFVVILLFFGSGLTIMSFHTDVSMPKVHQTLYQMFTGEFQERPYILQIPYSIGIALGIIVFFNHIIKKNFDEDPTPLEVDNYLYEDNVQQCIKKTLSNKQQKGGN